MLGGISLATIAKFVLILLKLADKFSDHLLAKKYQDEGYEKAKAEANAEMLRKSTYAKKVQDYVDGLSDSDVDSSLQQLEPSGTVSASQEGTGSRK